MNNIYQSSPMDNLKAFAVAYAVGALTTAIAAGLVWLAKHDELNF